MTQEEEFICEAIDVAIRKAKPSQTVTSLASAIGVTYDKLSNVVNRRTRPTDELIAKVRAKLKLPATWPGRSVDGREGQLVSLAGLSLSPVRVVGHAEAGPGLTNVDVEAELVYVPDRLAQIGTIGWIVAGESMMPALEPGDTVLFREWRTPRRGYPFLVKSDAGEFRVKVMDWASDGWVLRSLNPTYAIEPLGTHEVVGILVGWYRSQGSRETLDSDPNGLRLE